MSAESDRTDDLWDDMSPDQLRDRAAESDRKAQASWDRSDTDGFVSQWAHGITAQRDRAQARLQEAGGLGRFLALFDLDGKWVAAKIIDSRYGKSWLTYEPEGRAVFLPVMPKRRVTLARKGYVEGYVLRPAEAQIMGGGRGLSGAASCYVGLEPTDNWRDAPAAILTPDRWDIEEVRT